MILERWWKQNVSHGTQSITVRGDTPATLRNNLYGWRNAFQEAAERVDREIAEKETRS